MGGGIEGKEGKWVKWEGQRVGGSYILGGVTGGDDSTSYWATKPKAAKLTAIGNSQVPELQM